MLAGAFGMLAQGIRLSRRATSRALRDVAPSALEPPDTAMVRAARELVEKTAGVEMRGHVYRTGYWTQLVLRQDGERTPAEIETAWVAALLHDVGPERPASRGESELEARYPRAGFRRRVLASMKEEARRVPGGRFALVRHFFPLLLKA